MQTARHSTCREKDGFFFFFLSQQLKTWSFLVFPDASAFQGSSEVSLGNTQVRSVLAAESLRGWAEILSPPPLHIPAGIINAPWRNITLMRTNFPQTTPTSLNLFFISIVQSRFSGNIELPYAHLKRKETPFMFSLVSLLLFRSTGTTQ